jgi:hypothetical protein
VSSDVINKNRFEAIVYEKWHERRGTNKKEIETVEMR